VARPNKWLERTGGQPTRHGRAAVGAGRSTTGRWADENGFPSASNDVRARDAIVLMRLIEARYEKGLLKPTEPLALRPGESVTLIVVRRADPRRWDLARLAKAATPEESSLTEQGLGEWANALDERDHD